MSQSKIVGAVEIGTSKTVVLVGEIVNGTSLNIVGKGISSSVGVKKGEILDFRGASNATHAAISEAEKSAGALVEEFYLAQTGRHLDGFCNTGSVTVSAADGVVRPDDLARAMREGKGKELPPERVYIHHVKNGIQLDGRETRDPLGMQGQRLEVGYWSIHGDERRVRDNLHVINGYGTDVKDLILSAIASGSMVAGEEEKQAGLLVLDIGCGTSDWVLYQKGFITQTGVVAVGGDHLSNDLALGLRISRQNAEHLKKQCGRAFLDKNEPAERVWMVGDQMIGDRHIPLRSLVQILNVRLVELFSIVKKQIGAASLPAGVILTGGTSQLTGIAEVAGEVFGCEARVGSSPDWVRGELRGPEFCTAVGLLNYALTGQHQDNLPVAVRDRGLLKRVVRFIAG